MSRAHLFPPGSRNGPPAASRLPVLDDAPPQALDAERSVLAAMLLGQDAVGRAVEMMDASIFSRPAHQKIFNALAALHNRGERADSITLTAELQRRDDLAVVGGSATIAHILEYATTTANLAEHIGLVREAATRRRIRDLGRNLADQVGDPRRTVGDVLEQLDREREKLRASHRDAGAGRFASAVVSATELVTREVERPRSLLGNGVLVAGGLAILYGRPGAGKSWLSILLARALVRGEPWLGLATPADGVRVGVLQLELSAHSVQSRLRALGVGTHERDSGLRVICRPHLKGAVDLLQPEHMTDLRAWVKADRLDLLVLDALSRVHVADENSAKDFGAVLAVLDGLRHETGAAVLGIHHEPKPRDGRNPDDDLSALRGTSRLQSDPTLLVRVVMSRGLRCIRFAKVSEAPEPDPIYFQIGEDGQPEVVKSPVAVRAGNRERVLKAVLEAERSLRNGEIAVRVKLSEATTRRHLGALLEAGEIHVTGDGCDTRDTRYSRSPAQPAHDEGRAGELPLSDNGMGDETTPTRSRSPIPTRSPAQPAPLKGEQGGEREGESTGGPARGVAS